LDTSKTNDKEDQMMSKLAFLIEKRNKNIKID
jgi:hypothetical protein